MKVGVVFRLKSLGWKEVPDVVLAYFSKCRPAYQRLWVGVQVRYRMWRHDGPECASDC